MEASQPSPRRRRFFKYAGLGALFAGAASAVAWQAHAHGGRWRGGFDPARLDEHLERALKHLYVEIDATEEQKQQLAPIVKQAAKELMPLRESMHEARKRGLELLTAPQVDRNALERLRAEQLAAAQAGSQRLVQALADVSDVLTPEQRRGLAERLQRHRGGWHRG